ncbi:chemotaxis protein CheB [Thalassotalea fusca]
MPVSTESNFQLMINYGIVVMGASQGGINAWKEIFPCLDKGLKVPVIVVQHQKANSGNTLVQFLDTLTELPVEDVVDGMAMQSGHIYLAPANYHLLVNANTTFSLDVSAPVQFSRPSIDVTFQSALSIYGKRLLAVLLTGANSDGALAMKLVNKIGGTTIVEDPSTAEAFYMPKSAIAQCYPDYVLPLAQLSQKISQLTGSFSQASNKMESTL